MRFCDIRGLDSKASVVSKAICRKIVLLLLSLQLVVFPVAEAQDVTPDEQQIENLSGQILHREIDLERFYLKYRVSGTQEPKWRRLRYYALQVGATSTALACNVIFLKLSKDGLKAPGVQNFGKADADTDDAPESAEEAARSASAPDAGSSADYGSNGSNGGGASSDASGRAGGSKSVGSKVRAGVANRIEPQGAKGTSDADEPDTTKQVQAAFILNLISTVLDGASNGIELGSSIYTSIKNKINKNDPSSTVDRVIERVKEIDALLAERDALVQKNKDLPTASIHQAEGRVLKTFRDWCLSEFADVYAEVKSTHSSCNVYYGLALAADGAYLAGSVLGLKATRPGKEYLNGPAIQTAIIGDSIGITSAPGSALAAKVLYKYHRKKLEKKLEQRLGDHEENAKAAMAELNKEIMSADTATLRRARSIRERASAYLLWAGRYDRFIDKELVELSHQNKVALQGELSGPMISSSYLACDILAAIGFYKFPNDARRASSLAYAGTICSDTGNSVSLFLTNYFLINEIMHRRKLKKKGMLPEQLLAERFKTLDQLDVLIDPANRRPIGIRNKRTNAVSGRSLLSNPI